MASRTIASPARKGSPGHHDGGLLISSRNGLRVSAYSSMTRAAIRPPEPTKKDVSKGPGSRMVTLIPNGAISFAKHSDIPSMANLAAEYAEEPANPCMHPIEEKLKKWPLRRDFM